MKWRAVVRVEDGEVDESFSLYVHHYSQPHVENSWKKNHDTSQGRVSIVGGNWFWVEVDEEEVDWDEENEVVLMSA